MEWLNANRSQSPKNTFFALTLKLLPHQNTLQPWTSVESTAHDPDFDGTITDSLLVESVAVAAVVARRAVGTPPVARVRVSLTSAAGLCTFAESHFGSSKTWSKYAHKRPTGMIRAIRTFCEGRD